MIQLGKECKDKVTGFTGIATARVQYLTGCDQYSLTPPVKDGALPDIQAFDEGRLEVIGNGILPEEVTKKNIPPGGPQRDTPPAKKSLANR